MHGPVVDLLSLATDSNRSEKHRAPGSSWGFNLAPPTTDRPSAGHHAASGRPLMTNESGASSRDSEVDGTTAHLQATAIGRSGKAERAKCPNQDYYSAF